MAKTSSRLRELHEAPKQVELDHRQRELVESYIACFNRRDWDALQRLIQADARIEVVGSTEFAAGGSPYFGNYLTLPWEWKLSLAVVDGEPTIVHWRKSGDHWLPKTAIRLWWQSGKVARIRDYVHVDYLLNDSRTGDST